MAFVKVAELPKPKQAPPKPVVAPIKPAPVEEPEGWLSSIKKHLKSLAGHKGSGITKQSAKQLQDRIEQEHSLGMDRQTGYTGD